MLNLRSLCLALSLVAASATPMLASNLVTNGSFDTGNFSGWTVNQAPNYSWNIASSNGNFYASDGCVGQTCITGTSVQQSFLEQTLNTIAGHSYTLTYQFGTNGQGNPMEFQSYFGSTLVQDLLNSAPVATTSYSFTVTATGSQTLLEFLARQDPGFDLLDNVSVTDNGTSPVPEPGTVGMVGTGILGLLTAARRKLLA